MSVSQIEGPKSTVGSHKNVRVLKDVQTLLVEYVDRDGTKHTRLAVIIAGQDIRFLADDALSGSVAAWLSDSIFHAAGITPPKKVD